MAETTTRTYIDCRDVPSESGCSLRISGTRDEVLNAAVDHAVASHGHARTAELRDMIARPSRRSPRERRRPPRRPALRRSTRPSCTRSSAR